MKLCCHLNNIYEIALRKGNTAIANEHKTWDKLELVIRMKRPLDFDEYRDILDTMSFVETFEHISPHAPDERGYFCNRCQQVLTGPIDGCWSEEQFYMAPKGDPSDIL